MNRGFPPPRTIGATQRRYSSIRPFRVKAADRLALPKMYRSLPDSFFSFATSPSAFCFTTFVLFQSALASVFENTSLGTAFMKSAMSPFSFDQYAAMPSYVTRPKRRAPIDFDCSSENFSSSSPHTVSCQPMSQLFLPSKNPSKVTRFHMMSFRKSSPASRSQPARHLCFSQRHQDGVRAVRRDRNQPSTGSYGPVRIGRPRWDLNPSHQVRSLEVYPN